MSTKERILQATSTVVARDGSTNMTLEAVAAEAGVSKGGLLYHFPSKRALLEGLLDAMLEHSQQALADSQRDPRYEGNFVAAYIASQLNYGDKDNHHVPALLAAAAQDPSLLSEAREQISDWLQQSGKQGELATSLLLAALGIRLLDHLQLLPEKPGQAGDYYQLLAEQAKPL